MPKESFVLDLHSDYHRSSNRYLFGELMRGHPDPSIRVGPTSYWGTMCLRLNDVILEQTAFYISDLQVGNLLSLRQLMRSGFEVLEFNLLRIRLLDGFGDHGEITADMVDGKYQLEIDAL
jgi:hypothetical protein